MVIYLARTYGQEHSLFGTAAHKRNQKHQLEVLGMFSGVAPFKGSYQPEAKLIDFIKEEDAAFILRLLDLQFTNVQLDYPVDAEIKASTVIVKAQQEDWTGYTQGLGWEKYAANSVIYTVPGDHFSMVKNKEALTLAACLKNHLICYTDL